MKKFLSILLALTMILSTVSFAAPAMVGTVETVSDVSVPRRLKLLRLRFRRRLLHPLSTLNTAD